MTIKNEWKQFLVHPPEKAGVHDIFSCWQQRDILIEIPIEAIPFQLERSEFHALPGRIRGALGQKLMEGASAQALSGGECPWNPPCALDVFFRCQFKMTGGLELPRPFNISVVCEDNSYFVKLSLFGEAVQYVEVMAECLTASLKRGVFFENRGITPLTVANRLIIDAPLYYVDDLPFSAAMNFLSPFCQRNNNELEIKPDSLLVGLLGRIKGIALWHGIEFDIIWKNAKAKFRDVQWDTSHLLHVKWQRYSSRQIGRTIPMEGMIGPLLMRGDLRSIIPILLIGERIGVGAHTAHGMGQYFIEFI